MMVPLLHLGMLIVGVPYSVPGMIHTEARGGTPYGATTIAGPQGQLQPTADDLAIARILGKRVAATMELAGAVASGKEAVQSFTEQRPDATLMDLDLPPAAGITAIQEILKIDPAACVIGLYTYKGDVSRAHALRAGARSCLTKDRLNEYLVSLVRDCARCAG